MAWDDLSPLGDQRAPGRDLAADAGQGLAAPGFIAGLVAKTLRDFPLAVNSPSADKTPVIRARALAAR